MFSSSIPIKYFPVILISESPYIYFSCDSNQIIEVYISFRAENKRAWFNTAWPLVLITLCKGKSNFKLYMASLECLQRSWKNYVWKEMRDDSEQWQLYAGQTFTYQWKITNKVYCPFIDLQQGYKRLLLGNYTWISKMK